MVGQTQIMYYFRYPVDFQKFIIGIIKFYYKVKEIFQTISIYYITAYFNSFFLVVHFLIFWTFVPLLNLFTYWVKWTI